MPPRRVERAQAARRAAEALIRQARARCARAIAVQARRIEQQAETLHGQLRGAATPTQPRTGHGTAPRTFETVDRPRDACRANMHTACHPLCVGATATRHRARVTIRHRHVRTRRHGNEGPDLCRTHQNARTARTAAPTRREPAPHPQTAGSRYGPVPTPTRPPPHLRNRLCCHVVDAIRARGHLHDHYVATAHIPLPWHYDAHGPENAEIDPPIERDINHLPARCAPPLTSEGSAPLPLESLPQVVQVVKKSHCKWSIVWLRCLSKRKWNFDECNRAQFVQCA